MNISIVLGLMTVVINILLLFVIIVAIFVSKRRDKHNYQLILLFIANILLIPVFVFENALYLQINYSIFNNSDFSLTFMKLSFILGILGYLVYNLHLLSIRDFPTGQIILLSLIAGFDIGAMLTSTQLDISNSNPIYYEPIKGGIYHISALMVFNLVGFFGFYFSAIYNKNNKKENNIMMSMEAIAIINFFISPIIIFALRIMKISGLPFNFIFLTPEIAFIIHYLLMIYYPQKSGYPMQAELISISLIEIETKTVIGGYEKYTSIELNKISGMRYIAVDANIRDMVDHMSDEINKFEGNYGGVVFIRNSKYFVIATIMGNGKKIATFALNMLINKISKLSSNEIDIDFTDLLNKYLYSFIHKKSNKIDSKKVYLVN